MKRVERLLNHLRESLTERLCQLGNPNTVFVYLGPRLLLLKKIAFFLKNFIPRLIHLFRRGQTGYKIAMMELMRFASENIEPCVVFTIPNSIRFGKDT